MGPAPARPDRTGNPGGPPGRQPAVDGAALGAREALHRPRAAGLAQAVRRRAGALQLHRGRRAARGVAGGVLASDGHGAATVRSHRHVVRGLEGGRVRARGGDVPVDHEGVLRGHGRPDDGERRRLSASSNCPVVARFSILSPDAQQGRRQPSIFSTSSSSCSPPPRCSARSTTTATGS